MPKLLLSWTLTALTLTVFADTIRYSYDAAGRLISADYGVAAINYTYDKAGNLIRREVTSSGPRFVSLSSASFDRAGVLAPSAIATGFGPNLAAGIALAQSADLPDELLGTSVDVTDSAGITRRARLIAVTPAQISYIVPADTALGTANVTVNSGAGGTVSGTLEIAAVAPGIYTANQAGTGVASAFFLRVASGGAQTQDLVFDPAAAAPVPIDLGAEGDQVYLLLFGTGLRGVREAATATVGGVSTAVAGPVAHSVFAGLDQVNLGPLSRSLAGRGDVDVVLTVDGKRANTVTVRIR